MYFWIIFTSSLLVGRAGQGFRGGWWAHPDQDIKEPASGGVMSLGSIFIHHLSNHRVTRHALKVRIPKGWFPEDPEEEWYGPKDIHPTDYVLNLADLRFFLFEKAIHPALVVRYQKAAPKDGTHRISYWSPKADWTVTKTEFITICPQDR